MRHLINSFIILGLALSVFGFTGLTCDGDCYDEYNDMRGVLTTGVVLLSTGLLYLKRQEN